MSKRRIIETFNTHRIAPDVVVAIATGRDVEKNEVMKAIRRSAEHPERSPEHLIVYGERGSGKSFLMRMVEIEVEGLALAEGAPVVCVLLPEEHYNIRSAHQILEAIADKVRGADWTASAYALDFRPAAEAWDSAVEGLHAALDERFGAGQGLAVAMIENFDILSKDLFGEALVESPRKGSRKNVSAAAVERRASEERLRKLMGKKGGRFMLIATATGTVDLDYERPLFLAFKPVDLSIWNSDACIEYFNRRRAVEQRPPLTLPEEARGRAIAEFIGGNPRLAQLLADVLESPDAQTIAQTLDQLSDHLAEYYRRRIEDLPPSTRGVLDALIRKGEPCSQSKLAERVGVRQNQIADAFRYLVTARLLSAETEKDGAGTLYRVRDRLFVHFYRRRYGEPDQTDGLAPIAELLERFFTVREREEQTRRHLELGEFAEARVYHCTLAKMNEGACRGFCRYRDGLVMGAPNKLFELAGLAPDEMEMAQTEFRERPDAAVKHWSDVAAGAQTPLWRTAALLLKAIALSRYDMDEEAWKTLEEALRVAETDETSDACIIALDQMATFLWYRFKDESRALELCRSIAGLIDRAHSAYARGYAHVDLASSKWHEKRYRQAVEEAVAAFRLAVDSHDIRLQCLALKQKVYGIQGLGQHSEVIRICEEGEGLARQVRDLPREADFLSLKASSLSEMNRHEEAVSICEEATKLAQQAGDIARQATCIRNKGYILGEMNRHEEAITVCEEAAKLAQQAGDIAEQAESLNHKAWSLNNLNRVEDALLASDQAIKLAIEVKDAWRASQSLRFKAYLLEKIGQLPEALEAARASVAMSGDGSVGEELRIMAFEAFSSIAAQMPASDVVERLEEFLKEKSVDKTSPSSWVLRDVSAAVARAEKWTEFQLCISEHKDRLSSEEPWNVFGKVGKVWADQVEAHGRAHTFGSVARDLPIISRIMRQIPHVGSTEDWLKDHLSDLVAGLVASCSDPGFLLDVSHLVVNVFGPEAESEARRLRSFADFHAAEDKEKVLQKYDPDLATAIRRMWNVPEPEDVLAKQGRRRGR
jgi:tetratricopeptide (TPR) repeat protein